MLLASATTTKSTPIFLLPNGTFFAELILFVLIFGFVAKVILPPLKGAMDERARTVRSAQQASDEGQAEAVRLVEERRKVLDDARTEARSALDEAAQEAEQLFEEGRAKAQAEHDRILAEAAPQFDEERRRVEQELSAKLGELVAAAASQVVGGTIDPARHQHVIDDAVAQVVGAVGASGN